MEQLELLGGRGGSGQGPAPPAKQFVASGLINHGWTYINIDDSWQGIRGGQFNGIQPNEKFPDMKGLADEIHNMGLKIGIYSTPWITSYAGYCGGSSNDADGKWDKSLNDKKNRNDGSHLFADNDAKQWAAWGIDYLKYDWNPRSTKTSNDKFLEQTKSMHDALVNSGRDIFFSYSNSMPFDAIEDQSKLLNCLAHDGRHSRQLVEPHRHRILARANGRRSAGRGISTTPTCSSSAMSAGARSCIRRISPPTSSTRTSACGALLECAAASRVRTWIVSIHSR